MREGEKESDGLEDAHVSKYYRVKNKRNPR